MLGSALLAAAVIGSGGAAAPAGVLDPSGAQVDALQGVFSWVRSSDGESVLMRRLNRRTSRIPGTLAGLNLRGPDLGLDRSGRIALVYGRCTGGRCQGPFVADVRRGGQRRLELPGRPGCEPGVTASVWRDRVAFALRCKGDGSGVYVKRGDRVRRLVRLSHDEAKAPSIDLVGAHAVIDGRLLSTGSGCEVPFREPARPDYATSAIDFHPGRVWWVREQIGAYGGGDSELLTAAIGPRCRVQRLGDAQPLSGLISSQPPLASSLAVDGDAFYLDVLDEGVQSGPLSSPR